jgi:DNA repair protein RadC
MTNTIRDAAKGVNIALHDHIIVAKSGTVSFVDQGLL